MGLFAHQIAHKKYWIQLKGFSEFQMFVTHFIITFHAKNVLIVAQHLRMLALEILNTC
jgi:hypothetical protein